MVEAWMPSSRKAQLCRTGLSVCERGVDDAEKKHVAPGRFGWRAARRFWAARPRRCYLYWPLAMTSVPAWMAAAFLGIMWL